MDLWCWLLYLLPVSGALKIIPEVKMEGKLGGSITFKCPLSTVHSRIYLCREMVISGRCNTMVSRGKSGDFLKKEYSGRITLKVDPDKNLFLVEMTKMRKHDSGIYACGMGLVTDRDKTQKITLSLREHDPFWDGEPATDELPPQTPEWLHQPLYLTTALVPAWLLMPEDASPSELLVQVTTPAPRTQAPPAPPKLLNTPIIHRPPISRTSSVTTGQLPKLPPSTTAPKSSAWEERPRPQPASYHHQTRLPRPRTFNYGSSGSENHGFHILIPTILGLMLLALLGMVVRRAIQRRKVLSKRVRRLAIRMRALEASQRPRRPQVSPRQRSQNIYSACPLRARGANAVPGPEQATLPGPGGPEHSSPFQLSPAQQQVSEVPWSPAPSLKTSCEDVSFYHQPPAQVEDEESTDYVNMPSLTHLPSCPPEPGPLCQ